MFDSEKIWWILDKGWHILVQEWVYFGLTANVVFPKWQHLWIMTWKGGLMSSLAEKEGKSLEVNPCCTPEIEGIGLG